MLVAVGALAAAGAWGWFASGRLEVPKPAAWEAIPPGEPIAAEETTPPPVAHWPAAEPEPRGGKRRYELFTPPPLTFDERTGRMVVRDNAASAGGKGGAGDSAAVELLAVEQPLYRVQLIGFVGEGEGCRGLLENVATSETFLAASGVVFPKLDLNVETLELRPMAVVLPGAVVSRQRIAVATLRDLRAGTTVTLRSDERCRVGPVTATVRVAGDNRPRDVAEGETLAAAGAEIMVRRIQREPPRLRVVLKMPDGRREERELAGTADRTEATP